MLVYSTFLGGNDEELNAGVYVDGSGIYTAGTTYSFNFPTNDLPFQGGDYDCFMTKFNPQGNAYIYSTYFGGNADDSINYFELAARRLPLPDGIHPVQ